MPFVVAGLNIADTPVEVLESVAVTPHALPGWLSVLATQAGGGVILSTCNRTEVYGEADDPQLGATRLTAFLDSIAAGSGRAGAAPSAHVFSLSGDAAVRHLFRVTAGLGSLALGEAQVAGQVSDALKAAGEAGAVQPRVSRLFHGALRTARRVRQKSGLGRDRVSVPSIGVQLIERALGDLHTKSALLLGAGDTGETVARALRNAGVGRLTVASRRTERAATLARELGGSAVPFAYRDFALAEADILVACTAAEVKPVVTAASVDAAMRSRPDRPLFILDVGMPRDVDPLADRVPGVTLRTLHSLDTIAAEHRESRKEAAGEAEALIEREVRRFTERLTGMDAEPTVRQLGERAEAVRQSELGKALRRLPGLSAEEQQVLDAMSRALVSRLLAAPIEYLRSSDGADTSEAVAIVFDLDPEG